MSQRVGAGRFAFLGVVVALASLTAACGGDGSRAGRVRIVGSTTAQPVMAEIVGAYLSDHPDAEVSITGTGTGDGLLDLCEGRAEIAMASRPATAAELARCRANRLGVVEVALAVDAVVVVSGDRDGIRCLTLRSLYALAGPESTGLADRSSAAVLAASLGEVTPEFGEGPLRFVVPGLRGGTTGVFIDEVVAPIARRRDLPPEVRRDSVVTRSDRLVADAVRNNAGAIGILGFTAAGKVDRSVEAVAIDGGGGCISPKLDTLTDGTYPLRRELRNYVAFGDDGPSEPVEAIIGASLGSGAQELVAGSGAVPLSEEDLAAARKAWSSAR